MLGVILIYVAIVLISNGIAGICKVDGRSQAIMNLFTGGLGLILNIIAISITIAQNGPMENYYASATGLLFAFTYLYVALNGIFNLDTRLYGWYSLFVTINTIPAGILCFMGYGGNNWYGIIWWMWGVLWLTGWIANVAMRNSSAKSKRAFGLFSGWLSAIEGIVTAWIPGFLILVSCWPATGWVM